MLLNVKILNLVVTKIIWIRMAVLFVLLMGACDISRAEDGSDAIEFACETQAGNATAKPISGKNVASFISIGAEYISRIDSVSNVYLGSRGRGIIVGYKSTPGKLVMIPDERVRRVVSKIDVRVYQSTDGSDTFDVDLSVNDCASQRIENCVYPQMGVYSYVFDESAPLTRIKFNTTGGGVYISSFVVYFADGSSAVGAIGEDGEGACADPEYYDLNGVRLSPNSMRRGVVIERRGNVLRKVLMP